MTKAERLELLKQIEKDIYVCSLESTFLDDAKSCAIHSAIEELEQEPCEDCISREAVLALKTPVDTMIGWSGYMIDALDVEQLPSVQPKPKTDVLDKIRAELHATAEMHEDGDYYLREEWIDEYFDEYKAESEG